MIDKKLIKSCIRGDRKAQHALYQANKVYLFGICMRYGKNRQEAEDMLQEGFYRILKDLKQFSGNTEIKAWMRKVMVNSALMYIRKHHKLSFATIDDYAFDIKGPKDTSLLEEDRSKAIIYMVRQLPAIQQTVFNLRAMEEYSFKEISALLGGNEATLRSHYLRARKALQELLKKELS